MLLVGLVVVKGNDVLRSNSFRFVWQEDVETAEVADAVWKRMKVFAKQNGMKRISQLFDEFDTDGSGAIDASEFAQALEKMGINGMSPKVLKAVIGIVDKDGDGEIDLSELVDALKMTASRKEGDAAGVAERMSEESSSDNGSTKSSRGRGPRPLLQKSSSQLSRPSLQKSASRMSSMSVSIVEEEDSATRTPRKGNSLKRSNSYRKELTEVT
jgi:Ca2+-binding EF-hand superfamily protein